MKECFITRQIIEADISIAQSLFNNKTEWDNNPALINMCAFHSAQAIEKTLKLYLNEADSKLYDKVSNTHQVPTLLFILERTDNGFINSHGELCDFSFELTQMNNARYGTIDVSPTDAIQALNIAHNLYNELIILQNKSKNKENDNAALCQNENYINQAIELVEKRMRSTETIITPNGVAKTADGYMINGVKQGNRCVHVEVTMYSRSKNNGVVPKDGDRCTFVVSHGKVYDEKQWRFEKQSRNINK